MSLTSQLDRAKATQVFLGAFLVSVFRSLREKATPLKIFRSFGRRFGSFLDFKFTFSERYSDASFSAEDLLRYFGSFLAHDWFRPLEYDHARARKQRSPSAGDFNWIFEGTVLALASPVSNVPFDPQHPPQQEKGREAMDFGAMVDFLRKGRVEALFRFNNCLYDEDFLRKRGVRVFGMEFKDGYFPPPELIREFLQRVFR